jgi:hypothetical protein
MTRQISCPSCGGPLQIESAFTTFVVCNYCGQSLYVHDTGVDLAGKTAKLAEYPSRLSVGARGQIKGRGFQVLGRIRYQNDDGFWDDWFLKFDDQRIGWVDEDEGEFTLTYKAKLTSPIPPFEQIRVGGFMPLGQDRMFVSEKGSATVLGAEGEVATAPHTGKPLRYVDGNAANKAIRLMLDDDAIMLYTGEPLEFKDLVVQNGA